MRVLCSAHFSIRFLHSVHALRGFLHICIYVCRWDVYLSDSGALQKTFYMPTLRLGYSLFAHLRSVGALNAPTNPIDRYEPQEHRSPSCTQVSHNRRRWSAPLHPWTTYSALTHRNFCRQKVPYAAFSLSGQCALHAHWPLMRHISIGFFFNRTRAYCKATSHWRQHTILRRRPTSSAIVHEFGRENLCVKLNGGHTCDVVNIRGLWVLYILVYITSVYV